MLNFGERGGMWYMGVSENGGTPKSSILIGISIINRPFWGTPMFGNIHMYIHGISTSNHHFLPSGAAKVKVEKVERPVMGPKPPGGDMNSVRFGGGKNQGGKKVTSHDVAFLGGIGGG